MCREAPGLCSADRQPGASPYALSPGELAALHSVNTQVNRTIAPVDEAGDVWTPHVSRGDCEDYALTKKVELLARGWSASHLLIAVVDAPGIGAHAVLIARTDQGDLVLDNLTDQILPWNRTGLIFRSRQSENLPAMWVRL